MAHHVIFEDAELALMKEVIKFVKQAKYTLEGDEILAAAQIVRWIESLPKRAQPYTPPELKLPPQLPAPTVPTSKPAKASTKRAK